MLRTLRINLKALTQNEYGFSGEYIRVKETKAPLIFENERGEILELSQGEDALVREFAFLRITNTHTADQTVVLAIGGKGAKLSSSTVSGVVQVINGEIQTTKSGAAFMASIGTTGLAGQYGLLQIFNPSNSAKNVFINQLLLTSKGTTKEIELLRYNTAIAAQIRQLRNKNGDLPDSLSYVTALSSAVVGSSLAGAISWGIVDGLGTGMQEIPLKEPILLKPSQGFIIGANEVACTIRANIQTTEESI